MLAISSRICIDATARAVFRFLSNLDNMPHYLPTLQRVVRRDADRVLFEGNAHGRAYAFEGYVWIDSDALSMSWGSRTNADYAVALQLFDTDEGCEVACRIECEPKFRAMNKLVTGVSDTETMLDTVLATIKTAFEADMRSRKPGKHGVLRA